MDPRKILEPFPFAVTEENRVEILNRMVVPLHDTPYEEQLSAKESYCRNSLRYVSQQLYRMGTPVRLDAARLPCKVDRMIPSPQLYKYRNTDDISIWYGLDGKTITAGYNAFPIGKHGDTVTMEPNGCLAMKDETIRLIDKIQEFLRTQTKLISFSLGQQGGWRAFKIFTNLNNELMLTGHLNPRTLKVREVIDDRDRFRDFMVKRCQEDGLKLESLYYQPCPHSFCKHEDVPYELLYGKPTLTEQIGKYIFLISPDSYNHQSSIGAEVLFDTVLKTVKDCFLDDSYRESVNARKKPVILDAQSGSGMLSIHLSELASRVIGIDYRSLSIANAKSSAELNGVSNCEFINSSLEVSLERIAEKYCRKEEHEMLVVCDIGPRGLHGSVIEALRDCDCIKKLVLVTSKIDSPRVQETLIGLCSKGKARSLPPFAPILATPVDVCPLTEMFYTVLAFERVPQ